MCKVGDIFTNVGRIVDFSHFQRGSEQITILGRFILVLIDKKIEVFANLYDMPVLKNGVKN